MSSRDLRKGDLISSPPRARVGPNPHPVARNLFEIIGFLQEREGVHLEARAAR